MALAPDMGRYAALVRAARHDASGEATQALEVSTPVMVSRVAR